MWSPSSGTNITGYNLYYGVASRAYTNTVAVGNSTNATISGLTDGVTYYFAATALDASGLESDYSNEATNSLSGAPNQTLTISGIGGLTTSENSATPAIPFTIGDARTTASNLTLWASSTNSTLLPASNIVFGGFGSNRTITLTPVPGQTGNCDVILYVSDGSASCSTAFHLTVLPASSTPQSPLTLVVWGNGKISPNLTSQKLTMGRRYTVSAAPAPGQIFYGWTGSVTSSSPTLTFVMKSNLVFQANFAPLNLTLSGSGTFSPDLRTSQSLTSGKPCTITAIPGAGQLFAGWTGTISSSAPRITFLMATSVVLHASFIPNPYLCAQGSYNGLFYESDTVRPASAGSFNVSATSSGSYAGSLQAGTNRLSFSGKLDFQLQATNRFSLNPSNTLTLVLHFGGGGDQAGQTLGTFSGGNWTSTLIGDRAVFNSKTNPAPYAGSYTLVFPGNDGDPSLPAGYGFGSVSVTSSGLVTFNGTLADGTFVSQSATVSKHGFWPLYIPLYSGRGSLLSWLAFTNLPHSDINGLVSWIKPASANAQYYRAGFTDECQAVGSAYRPPTTSSSHVLNLTNAHVAFSGGNLPADLTNSIVLGLSSKVTNLSSNGLTLSFSTSAGTFKGSVTDPATSKSLPFSGALLQKQEAGYGFLLGTNQSSRVNLTP